MAFPIFIPKAGNSLSLPPVVTFVYCDSAESTLAAYVSHLRAHEKLLFRVPAFNFVYAAPTPTKFRRASGFFSRLFEKTGRLNTVHFARYVYVRLLWETKRHGSLTRADRDLLRDGDRRYCGEPFESAYQKWSTTGLTEQDIHALLGPPGERPERSFQSYVLPEKYNLFWTDSAASFRPRRRERVFGTAFGDAFGSGGR